ncbi:hypothetical protein [Natrinema saccharevitans]|uniref:hypothetical protein n=1 Tax=Natrinema saccharevitans TaxID=301967 RepID=UPI00111597C9|nr:hypothetical protein [Natrinema saccharevitans]
MAGVSIGALASSSGTVLADSSDDQDRAIKVKDGRFVLDRENVGRHQYEILKPAIEDFNRAIEDGHIKLEISKDHTSEIEPLNKEPQVTVQLQSSVDEMVEGDE